MIRAALIILLVVSLLIAAIPGQAQSAPEFVQAGLDAIFVVDHAAGTTTALYSIRYTGNPAEVRWVFPIPADATKVALQTWSMALTLEVATEPSIEPPPYPCRLSTRYTIGEGVIPGPMDYGPGGAEVPVRLDSADAVLSWLAAGSVPPDDQQRAALESYAQQGFTFVGIQFAPQTGEPEPDDFWVSTNVQHSPTLLVEYPGNAVRLPLQFRAGRAASHLASDDLDGLMPVTAYIFARTPYTPQNYQPLTIDLTRIESGFNLLASTLHLTYDPLIISGSLDPAYDHLVLEANQQANGQGMVVEYVGQPHLDSPPPPIQDDPAFAAWRQSLADRGLVLTRARTFISPEQNLPDPTFLPAPGAPNFKMDLSTAVDPAWFWGCTSRKLIDPALEARLPAGRTRIDPLHLYVAHPEGWVLSDLENDLYVLAPQPVTYAMLSDMENNRGGPPMFAFKKFSLPYVLLPDGMVAVPDPAFTWFTKTSNRPDSSPARNAYALYWPTISALLSVDLDGWESARVKGVQMVIMSTYADWVTNGSLYDDMLLYASTYQYFTSPDLRHTLFMGDLTDLLEIGYPDGWIETLNADRQRLILPGGTSNPAESPYILVRSGPFEDDQAAAQWLKDNYGLDGRGEFGTPQPFAANGRRGYVVATQNTRDAPYIEVSAPTAVYDQYADLLATIAHAITYKGAQG